MEEGLYIGIDFHKKHSYLTGVNREGEVKFSYQITNDKDTWEKALNQFPQGSVMVMEATYNWYWLFDLINDRFKLILAHPLKTKAIASAKIKNDRIDSRVLAHLLRSGMVAESYIPPREIRSLREFIRFRVSIVRLSTMVKNKLRSLISKLGLEFPYSDLFTDKGLNWLRGLQLHWPWKRQLEGYLLLAERLVSLHKMMDKEILRLAQQNAMAKLLMSMPGIGAFTAMLLIAEIGDIERFATAGKLCSYAGLVPSLRASGDRVRRGHITKEGNKLIRWAMVEVAGKLKDRSPRFRAYYQKIKSRKGANVAKVAVARKALQIVWLMMKRKVRYTEQGASEHPSGTTPERVRV